jgi:HSP20 family protein
MYSYDQVLTDVRQVYEQLTGLQAPKVDPKNPRFPLPKEINPVGLVQNEINQLNLFLVNSGISLRLSKAPTWTPPAEVYETPERYVIRLELAGVDQSDVTVQQINNVLIVRGARRFRRESDRARYHSSERAYGAFERLFPLPPYVQADALNTQYSHGMLEIVLPKAAASGGSDKAEKPLDKQRIKSTTHS